MPKGIALAIGITLNILILSLPLLFIDSPIQEYRSFLKGPEVWGYYLLISLFCLLESSASQSISEESLVHKKKVFLPYLIGACILLSFWTSIFEYAEQPSSRQSLTSIVGGLLIIAGITIRLISIRKLNKYFVSHVGLIPNHQLVNTGIYSVVRHPSELGLLFICFGVSIMLLSTTGIMVTATTLMPLIIYRLSLEDGLLQAQFGQKYEQYKSVTPSLIPYPTFKKIGNQTINSSNPAGRL